MSNHPTCNKPDVDVPKLICGYPLPCPHHTYIIENGNVEIPEISKLGDVEKLEKIAKAIKEDED